PIADSRSILRKLDPDLRQRFLDRGIRYRRLLWHEDVGPLDEESKKKKFPGQCWQDYFQTREQSVAERRCAQGGLDYEWLPGGVLRVEQSRPACRVHPVTGETVWFNMAHNYYSRQGGQRHACFGDLSPIDERDILQIRAVYDSASLRFPWQRGDVLL